MTKLCNERAPGCQLPCVAPRPTESASTGITPLRFIVGPVGFDRSVLGLDHSFMANRKLKMQPVRRSKYFAIMSKYSALPNRAIAEVPPAQAGFLNDNQVLFLGESLCVQSSDGGHRRVCRASCRFTVRAPAGGGARQRLPRAPGAHSESDAAD